MSSSSAPPPARHVGFALAGQSQPNSEGEVADLLRRRMRVAFCVMVVYSALSAARELFRGAFLAPYSTSVFVGCLAMIVIVGTLTALMWSRRSFSLPALRRMELCGVGVGVLFVCTTQHVWFASGSRWLGAASLDPARSAWAGRWFYQLTPDGLAGQAVVMSWVDTTIVFPYSYSTHWLMAVILYGVFVPNTLRRGMFVIGGLVAVALLNLIAIALHSEPTLLGWYMGPVLLQTTLILAVGAVAALTATHKLTELRQYTAEVRKLGQYQLKERIGQGGMGEVYRAQHMLLRRPCAVKLIRGDTESALRCIQRFEREVQATASLQHPNIVDVYDYGRAEDGTFYYVMEYLPGLSLDALVRRNGPLSPGRAVYLLRQVCAALSEAHAVGLIHRDIKPSNILVCSRGTQHDLIKLLDFGLVQFADRGSDADAAKSQDLAAQPTPSLDEAEKSATFRTLVGSILGTPAYMSPEQIRGDAPLDARSDLYSLGALAYGLLVGHPPFLGVSNMDIMAAHLATPAPSLCSRRQDIPADLEAVILRCLAKEREQRFASAAELDGALAACACASHWSAKAATAWWRAAATREASAGHETSGDTTAASDETATSG